MENKLHWGTVTPLLANTLQTLMHERLFNDFRLVGGTNLSLRFGHRRSDDIDLFCDADYGSVDFNLLEDYLKSTFPYCDLPERTTAVGFGKMYYIGLSDDNAVKLDLMYTDRYIDGPEIIDGVRMASLRQIAAMKVEAIVTGGRKKDWWDIHRLLEEYPLEWLLDCHKQWQPWTHNREEILVKLVDFSKANMQADPYCLLGKNWDDIRLDIIDIVGKNQ